MKIEYDVMNLKNTNGYTVRWYIEKPHRPRVFAYAKTR